MKASHNKDGSTATVWMTYAWADNKAGDIDFIAQELGAAGLTVKLDRWNLRAGARLWDQIADFITSPDQCDAWLLVATQASLGSEPCREEYAYALDRALNTRGQAFPIIALFPATVDDALIPAGIRIRLNVSLRDPGWKERIIAAAQNRAVDVARAQVTPYHIAIHQNPNEPSGAVIEIRPRAGSWTPFFAAVPAAENDQVKMRISHGPAGRVPNGSALFMTGAGTKDAWAFCFAQNEATPTMSYYVSCTSKPSKLVFGVDGGIHYTVELPR